jgi:methanogenic corrinoid protein MtbC1
LLRQATLSGRQIGQISRLSTAELRDLVVSDREAMARAPRLVVTQAKEAAQGHLAACLAAAEALDAQLLQYQLERAAVDLSQPRLMEKVLVPLLEELGTRWENGELRIIHEHVASSVIKGFLSGLRASFNPSDNAPSIVVGTPSRQVHEMGALLVSVAAAAEGWRVTYLGADLPAEEIAAAVQHKGARVIALSLVYPTDDPHLGRELFKLRRLIGEDVLILLGGRAARPYAEIVGQISAQILNNSTDLRGVLRTLRL